MNTSLDEFLIRKLPGDTYSRLNKTDRYALQNAVLGYSLHIHTFLQMRRIVKDTIKVKGRVITDLRQAVVANYNMSLGLKQCLLTAQVRQNQGNPVKIGQILREADLPDADEKVWLNLERIGLKDSLIKVTKKINDWPLQSTKTVQKNCQAELERLQYIFRGRVSKKLAFIAVANKFSKDDLYADLQNKAIETYYFLTPFVSPLHRTRSVVQAVNNHSIKMIDFWTFKKRARMMQDENGDFTNLVCGHGSHGSSNNLSGIHVPNSQLHVYNMSQTIPCENHTADYNDTFAAIETYIKSGPPIRRTIVNLLLLLDNPEFVRFVKKQYRMSRLPDTETVYDRLGDTEYYKAVADFTDRPLLVIERIVKELRNM